MCIGICQKCVKGNLVEKHHIYPKRFFGNKNNPFKLYLCEKCHRKLEMLIPRDEEMDKSFYDRVTMEFLCNHNK